MVWSHGLDSGNCSTSSLKTSKHSWYSAGTFSSAVNVSCVLYLKMKASDGLSVALIDSSVCSSVRLAICANKLYSNIIEVQIIGERSVR